MDRGKELVIVGMFDEFGNNIEVKLPTDDAREIILEGQLMSDFEKSIAEIAVSTIDLRMNEKHVPIGARC